MDFKNKLGSSSQTELNRKGTSDAHLLPVLLLHNKSVQALKDQSFSRHVVEGRLCSQTDQFTVSGLWVVAQLTADWPLHLPAQV